MSLKQDGVDDVILNGHPQKAFDLEGAYRHVMVCRCFWQNTMVMTNNHREGGLLGHVMFNRKHEYHDRRPTPSG